MLILEISETTTIRKSEENKKRRKVLEFIENLHY